MQKLASKFRFLGKGSIAILAILTIVGIYAVQQSSAYENGITGQTEKSTEAGCYCHCLTSSSGTSVSLTCSNGSSPLTAAPNTTYSFTIKVANSSEYYGGCDISTYSGSGLSAGSDGLQSENNELTHESAKQFSGGYTTWSFTYTSGTNGGWDTIYATGNAVNGDGQDDNDECEDNWNFAPKFIIHIVAPTKRMALSQNSISFGQVRVGRRVADSLKVTSNGDTTITISSSAMKSGAVFSSYPTTTNRTITKSSSEIDSTIFAPTSRGTFTDSLIYNTNSDTATEQRMGLAVSGQGIQAIFNTPYGASLSFGNLHAGKTENLTFNFSNSGDDTLFLQTPSISGTGFTVATGLSTLTYPPNASGSVTVQFAPTLKQSYSGSLSFTASNGVTAPTVSLSGAGVLPQIQISSPVSLGSERVGQTIQGSVSFKNVGTDTLHISNASITQASAVFTLGTYSQAIAPNGSGSVAISYTPAAEETDTGTLHFKSDDPTDSNVAVAISGVGTLPHMAVALADDTVKVGSTKVNSQITASIVVKNNGGATLNLSNVTAGPSPFSLQSNQSTVSPGTSINVTVAFTPTDTGTFTGKLVIHGDDPAIPYDTVYLSGSGINSSLSINPGSLDFGSVPILGTEVDTITLTDSGKANVTIYSVQLTPGNTPFSMVNAPPSDVLAGSSTPIIVSFHPDTAGSYSASISIETDDQSAPTRTVNLSGVGINDPFSVTPSALAFGQVPVSTPVFDTITMKNTGTGTVTISSYQCAAPSGGFTVVDSATHAVAAGTSAIVVVRFDPTLAQSYSGTLTVNTNDVSDPIHTIGLIGTGVKGSLTVNPFPIAFGNVVSGHDSSQRVVVRNAGLASVTITSTNLSGATLYDFNDGTITMPMSLGAADSLVFTMTFTPSQIQTDFDTLNFSLADGTKLSVPISGTGVSAASVSNVSHASFSMSLAPNPAGESMTITARIPEADNFSLDLFDAIGRQALHLPVGVLSAGVHEIPVALQTLADGTYFVRLIASDGTTASGQLIVRKQ